MLVLLGFVFMWTGSLGLECSQFQRPLARSFAQGKTNVTEVQVNIMADYVLFSHSHKTSCFFIVRKKMYRSEHSLRCERAGGRLAWLNHEWRWNKTVLESITDITEAVLLPNTTNHFRLLDVHIPLLFIGLYHNASYQFCNGWVWTNEDASQIQPLNTTLAANSNCTFTAQAYGGSSSSVKFTINVDLMNRTDVSYPSLMVDEYYFVNRTIHQPVFQLDASAPVHHQSNAICEFVVSPVQKTVTAKTTGLSPNKSDSSTVKITVTGSYPRGSFPLAAALIGVFAIILMLLIYYFGAGNTNDSKEMPLDEQNNDGRKTNKEIKSEVVQNNSGSVSASSGQWSTDTSEESSVQSMHFKECSKRSNSMIEQPPRTKCI